MSYLTALSSTILFQFIVSPKLQPRYTPSPHRLLSTPSPTFILGPAIGSFFGDHSTTKIKSTCSTAVEERWLPRCQVWRTWSSFPLCRQGQAKTGPRNSLLVTEGRRRRRNTPPTVWFRWFSDVEDVENLGSLAAEHVGAQDFLAQLDLSKCLSI